MNEELLCMICELIELVKWFLVVNGLGLAMCLSSVSGSAIYDLVTKRDERKKGKKDE